MNLSDEQIDRALRDRLPKPCMSREESRAVWERVEAGLGPGQAFTNILPDRRRPGSRRVALGVGLAAAVVIIGIIALGPWSRDTGSDEFALSGLESASAAEVLDATADAARRGASLVPGPKQALYSRITLWLDPRLDGGTAPNIPDELGIPIDEWIGADGEGVRVDGYGVSGSISSNDSTTRTEPEVDARRIDGNRIDPKATLLGSWRSFMSLKLLETIDSKPAVALDQIREAIDSLKDYAAQTRIMGSDFPVLLGLSALLMEAPLSGDQRAVLYGAIATAPDWYRNDGSAAVEISNQGRGVSRSGEEGIVISSTVTMSRAEAKLLNSDEENSRLEFLLDPEVGSVLEMRLFEGGRERPMFRITSDALELRPRSEMPAPTD